MENVNVNVVKELSKKDTSLINRGQILWVDLPQAKGSVQSGRRPVIVISNNKANKFSPVLLVAPLTSRPKKSLPTHASVSCDEIRGIYKDSTVLCEQLFTIDKNSIIDVVGCVSSDTLTKVNRALSVSLAL